MTVEDEEYIDIKSKPIYVPLEFDPKSRWSLLIAESEGLRGIIDLCSNSPAMKASNSSIMFAGNDAEQSDAQNFFNNERCNQLNQFDNQDALLADLPAVLANSKMGLRLYICGAEAFIWKVAKIARDAGMNKSEYNLKLMGSKARRVYCPHCEIISEGVTTDIHECQGCNLSLVNCNHFSREMSAYLGYRVDAEVPGEMPERQELYK
ncbi:MAG: dimethylamine monooxygenase subunit DmmA family protein [Cocleimonas sp.]